MPRRQFLMSAGAIAVTLVSFAVSAQPSAASQRGAGGPPAAPGPAAAQNLQVLPKDMPPAQILEMMQAIGAALGVQCGYCHVAAAAGARGRGGRGAAPAFDFAADDKPQKKTSRQMMLMVGDINPKVTAAVGRTSETTTRISCVTCHRGVAIPKQLTEILDQASAEKGLSEAVAQYKDLRKRYFGAQAYDFSEGTLIAYAQRATQANKPDEAIAWLQVNLDYYPLSAPTYAGLSQAQQKNNDRGAAIKSQEKAVELDPQNANFKRQLDQLKGQGPR